jgi:hypothetical protein
VPRAAAVWPKKSAKISGSKSSKVVEPRVAPDALSPTAAEIEVEAFKSLGRGAAAAKPLETVEFRLALAVDLAAIKLLLLVGVAQNFIGLVEFGEFFLGLGIVGRAIGMQLFGELTKGLFDLGLARRARHAEHGVWIAHGWTALKPGLEAVDYRRCGLSQRCGITKPESQRRSV